MTAEYGYGLLTGPRVELAVMPQLVEAISQDDDWTGTNDAAARRRAQTRLNTRAYRRRKALVKKAEVPSNNHGAFSSPNGSMRCWDLKQQCVRFIPASQAKLLYDARSPLMPYRPGKGRPQYMFPLCPDHLITLLQLNAFRAMSMNRELVSSILNVPLNCHEEVVHILPYPTRPEMIPSTLLPTALQQTMPHNDWIDIFPSPEGRDTLIRATGTFDEDDLWADCIGGLYEGFPDDEMGRRGIVAWSPPWDISGWEMSEGFLKKWGWLFRDFPGFLESTNRWRAKRGEEPLTWDDNPTHAGGRPGWSGRRVLNDQMSERQ
ncbi:hypothetical protein F5Y16DRAFT_404102 [Xylariaceae sp. FL0255]|nr:hypothetical protein F5Y16DRAFT_404102 [Xylariaceae sp. FL0255]